jgi:2-dehydropantoate 2-reductase
MEIIVLGAGAIGSLYGAKLAAHHDVILIGRDDHVRAIKQNGLRVEGIETLMVRPRAATAVDHIGANTLILLTTKVPATIAALEPIAPMVRDDTTVIALQNGLNSDAIAREALQGRGVVLRGITQFGAIFERPGIVRYMLKGYTLLEKHERSASIAEVFNSAGLDCRLSENIEHEVWRKLIYNCVVNSITAILGTTVGEIVDPILDPLKQRVIEECLAVAAREGISLNVTLDEVNEAYRGSPNIVSMRQDLLRARPTEIDYLNGAVVALGARRGMSYPVNDALTKLIKGIQSQGRRL